MVQEISATACAEALAQNPEAVLLDVRTAPEVQFVGAPTVANWRHISLTLFPPTQPDPEFLPKVAAQIRPDQPIYCLCKVGGRSAAAAQMLLSAGYSQVFNVSHGFDGAQNSERQRRSVNGWVAEGLPWAQP